MAAKLPTAQPANADFFGLLPGVPFTTATLSGNHTDSVGTITLTATVPTDWPTAGAVYVDNECIEYTGKSGATLTGASRGRQGTTAAAHTDAATVRCGLTKGTINQLIEELIQLSKTGAGAKGADVASAAALNIGEDGHYFAVTGTTTITSIEARLAGQVIVLRFDGALTLTHNATSLILQGGTNLTTAAGDVLTFVSEGSGNWREIARRLASASSGTTHSIVRKTADESVTSSTDLQNDDHLLFAIAANEAWSAEFVIFHVGTLTGDISFAFTVPAGATLIWGAVGAVGTGDSPSDSTADAVRADAVTASGTGFSYGDSINVTIKVLRVYVANGANAGNVQLQWAQATSDATATTVKAGSHLIAHKIA